MFLRTSAKGLKWTNVGGVAPTDTVGRVLKNKQLAKALLQKTEFTEGEVLGLNWRLVLAKDRPTSGRELDNSQLSEALVAKQGQGKTVQFSEQEWSSFGIADLCASDWIKGTYKKEHRDRRYRFYSVYWQPDAAFGLHGLRVSDRIFVETDPADPAETSSDNVTGSWFTPADPGK